MTHTTPTLSILAAVDEIMSLHPDVWYDNAVHFTQTEVSAFAELLVVCGHPEWAQMMLERWIDQEVEDREAAVGQWSVDPHLIRLTFREEPE